MGGHSYYFKVLISIATLYNSGTQEFFETWPVTGEMSSNCVRTFPMMEMVYKSSVINSKRDMLEAYDLEAKAQLLILSGAVNVSISLKFYQKAAT